MELQSSRYYITECCRESIRLMQCFDKEGVLHEGQTEFRIKRN